VVPEVASGVLAHRLTNVSRWADEKNAPGQHRPGTNTGFSSISRHAGGWLLGCTIRTYCPSIYFPYPPEISHQPSRHLVAPPSCKKCLQEHRSSPRLVPNFGVRGGHQVLHLRIVCEGPHVRGWSMVIRTNLPALFAVSKVL
jgi:hypothetical protein